MFGRRDASGLATACIRYTSSHSRPDCPPLPQSEDIYSIAKQHDRSEPTLHAFATPTTASIRISRTPSSLSISTLSSPHPGIHTPSMTLSPWSRVASANLSRDWHLSEPPAHSPASITVRHFRASQQVSHVRWRLCFGRWLCRRVCHPELYPYTSIGLSSLAFLFFHDRKLPAA